MEEKAIKENKNEILETPLSIFSKNNIIFIAAIFSPILGGGMLFYNLRKLGLNNGKNVMFLLFYLVLSFILIFAFNILYSAYLGELIISLLNSSEYFNARYSSMTIKIAFKVLINSIAIDYLWKIFFGKDVKYQSKDITIPVIIGVIILTVTLLWSYFL